MYRDFGTSFIFVLIGIILVAVPLVIQRILSPHHRKTPDKLSTYECGEDVEGPAWVKFNIRFYVVALIFIIFDVEVVFLFPWAVVYKELGLFAFVEMMIFWAYLHWDWRMSGEKVIWSGLRFPFHMVVADIGS